MLAVEGSRRGAKHTMSGKRNATVLNVRGSFGDTFPPSAFLLWLPLEDVCLVPPLYPRHLCQRKTPGWDDESGREGPKATKATPRPEIAEQRGAIVSRDEMDCRLWRSKT